MTPWRGCGYKEALTGMAVIVSFLVVLLAMDTTIIERTREIALSRKRPPRATMIQCGRRGRQPRRFSWKAFVMSLDSAPVPEALDRRAVSKSRTGLPQPGFPKDVDLAAEARKSRRRLYPVTVVYSAGASLVLASALRAGRPGLAVSVFAAGLAAWTYVEYLVHRHVLHGRFPEGPGLRGLLHRAFDHLHWQHHARPWDGNHINGTLKDTGPFVAVLFPLSFLAPVDTLPVLLAGILQGYILEEWVHHSVHFYNFRSRYFRYIRRHHAYHHSPRGAEVGFGLTNGFWDVMRGTRIPAEQRRLLSQPRGEGSTARRA